MVLKGWFIKRMMSDENIIKFGDFNYEGEEKNKSQIILSHTSREANHFIV